MTHQKDRYKELSCCCPPFSLDKKGMCGISPYLSPHRWGDGSAMIFAQDDLIHYRWTWTDWIHMHIVANTAVWSHTIIGACGTRRKFGQAATRNEKSWGETKKNYCLRCDCAYSSGWYHALTSLSCAGGQGAFEIWHAVRCRLFHFWRYILERPSY